MMAKVLRELAVVIGSYQDRSTGQTKNRYRNIGVLMEGESNGETYRFLLIDRSFNPAGVPFKDGSDKIIVNMFKPRDQQDQGGGQDAGGGSSYQDDRQAAPPSNLDDEIPF